MAEKVPFLDCELGIMVGKVGVRLLELHRPPIEAKVYGKVCTTYLLRK